MSIASKIGIVFAIMSTLMGARAYAAPPSELLREMAFLPAADGTVSVANIQIDLAWLGFYTGSTHGQLSRETRDALIGFQNSIDVNATGQLSSQDRETLTQRANATQAGYRFVRQDVEWLGMSVDVPMAFVSPAVLDAESEIIRFRAPSHSSLFSFSLWHENVTRTMTAERLTDAYLTSINGSDADATIIAASSFSSSLFIAYEVNGFRYTRIAQVQNNQWRVVQFGILSSDYWDMRPVMLRMLRSLNFFDNAGLSELERAARLARGEIPGSAQTPAWYNTMTGNGSGSIVSRQGHVLTNAHVVSSCGRLTVNGNPAVLIGTDSRLDLALIRSENLSDRRPVRFRSSNPQLGEVIAVMGYPVFQFSRALNYTTGTVSSAVGIYGDRTRLQVTAPIQPGNSGGPVLDVNGRQVAVVVAKASSSFQESVNVENIGWVIRGRQAVDFLNRFDVFPIVEDRALETQRPDPDTVNDWRSFVMRIECHEF